jgi:hypothetical protein
VRPPRAAAMRKLDPRGPDGRQQQVRALSERRGSLRDVKAALLSALCFLLSLQSSSTRSSTRHSSPGLARERSDLSRELRMTGRWECTGGSVGCEACPLCSEVALEFGGSNWRPPLSRLTVLAALRLYPAHTVGCVCL